MSPLAKRDSWNAFAFVFVRGLRFFEGKGDEEHGAKRKSPAQTGRDKNK